MRLRYIAILWLLCSRTFAADLVTVHVLGLFHPEELVVSAEPDRIIIAHAGEREVIIGDALCTSATVFRIRSRVGLRCGELRVNSKRIIFSSVQGADTSLILAVPGKLHREYRGRLEIASDNQELVAVVDMDLETAVASIVAAELPGGTPLEALKAQALVARSFLVASGRRHTEADFCDTTHCQFLRNPPPATSAAAQAASATSDLVLLWKGKPFPAMYSASCGGRTHTLAEAGYRQRDYPYFAVECAYCRRHSSGGSSGGHGIGLCQKGTVAMAEKGADFRAIVTHYFPNTNIGSR